MPPPPPDASEPLTSGRDSDPSARRDDPGREGAPRIDRVQEASEESFPASDAPGWQPLLVGTPDRDPDGATPSDGS
jgi:hypothetical protein